MRNGNFLDVWNLHYFASIEQFWTCFSVTAPGVKVSFYTREGFPSSCPTNLKKKKKKKKKTP